MRLDEVQEDNAVSTQMAFDAAESRALRLTRALILAEAQVIRWKQMYVDAVNAPNEELERLRRAEENHWQPTNEGPPEWVCTTPLQCRGCDDCAEDETGPEVSGATD